MKRTCRSCYFYEQCGTDEVCWGYTALDEELSEEETDELIQSKKEEFLKDYYEYVSEYDRDIVY